MAIGPFAAFQVFPGFCDPFFEALDPIKNSPPLWVRENGASAPVFHICVPGVCVFFRFRELIGNRV